MRVRFSERLAELREERKLTKEKLAQELGVDDTTIGNWERARHEPVLSHLLALADFFDVSMDYLVGLEND